MIDKLLDAEIPAAEGSEVNVVKLKKLFEGWSHTEEYFNLLNHYGFFGKYITIETQSNKKTKVLQWKIDDQIILVCDVENKLTFIPKITVRVSKALDTALPDWPADNLKLWSFHTGGVLTGKDNSNSVNFEQLPIMFGTLDRLFQDDEGYSSRKLASFLYGHLKYYRSLAEQSPSNKQLSEIQYINFLGFLKLGFNPLSIKTLLERNVQLSQVIEMGLNADTPLEWLITLLGQDKKQS